MSEDSLFVVISKNKLKPLRTFVWTREERIVLAMPVNYKTNKKFLSGYIMITYGGVYVFRQKLISNPIMKVRVSFFDIRRITVMDKKTIEVKMELGKFFIKSKEIKAIIHVIKLILNESTFNVPRLKLIKFISQDPTPQVEIHHRPENLFIKRTILLAHFYDQRGEMLNSVKYFEKYEDNPTSLITLGPHF
ncbi:hypothetical protein TRFO_17504 [Tritrichomonas foetus]|uniref:Uncharacterized protein n=1 Tax=Tritrichomonas foetus TaxID=1144522 RepID=A0A1J4KT57_9EUKA|nr:hypothetical protein TRFO_17504 [Tritrichomonas foetus]|eukprot:OHT12669.1 hypothetical protein TRFO_17504 [Tritrichomonas foetus]